MFCPKGEVGPPTIGIVPPRSCVPTGGCVVTVVCLGKGKITVLPYPPIGICKFGATVEIVPLGLGLLVGNWGSVRMKLGIGCPGNGGPLGELARVYRGVGWETFNKGFNAWYPGGKFGLASGIRRVLIGGRVVAVIPVWTLVVFARWAISGGRTK
jgi:hypothetical protein